MLTVYRNHAFFPLTMAHPQIPLKEYVLYTQFNDDNYGRPLNEVNLSKVYWNYTPRVCKELEYWFMSFQS